MRWWGGLDPPLVILGLSLTAALAGAAWVRGGWLTRRFIILTALWFGVVATALLAQLKFPVRVAIPMLSFFALLLIALPEAAAPDTGPRPAGRVSTVVRTVAAVVTAAALVAGLTHTVAGVGHRRADNETYDKVLAAFVDLDPEGTLVYLSAATYYGRPSPWHAPMAPSSPLITFGWFQRTPIFDAQLAERGIDDLYLAISSREDVLLPLSKEWERLVGQPYLTYLEEHHGFTGLLRPRSEQGSYFAAEDRDRDLRPRGRL